MTHISDMVKYLFSELNKRKIEYCVLRNYEGLPENLDGHDIDIMIHRLDRKKVYDILCEMKKHFQQRGIRVGERQYVISYYFLVEEENRRKMLQIDLFFDMDWHGRTMLDSGSILNNRIKYKEIYIPRPAHEALITIFSSLIRGGFYKKKYHKNIKRLIQKDEAEFERVLEWSVGKYALSLRKKILGDDIRTCEMMVPVLRKTITYKSFQHYFFKTIFDMFSFVYWEILNRIFYSGTIFVIVGETDTICKNFLPRVYPYIDRYFKGDLVAEKYVLFPDEFQFSKKRLKRGICQWLHYGKTVLKQLHKTYGVIYCGGFYAKEKEPLEKRFGIGKPQLVFDLGESEKQKIYSTKTVKVKENTDIEKEVLGAITSTSRRKYYKFVDEITS